MNKEELEGTSASKMISLKCDLKDSNVLWNSFDFFPLQHYYNAAPTNSPQTNLDRRCSG